jgi:hypothetical protein
MRMGHVGRATTELNELEPVVERLEIDAHIAAVHVPDHVEAATTARA